MSMHRQIAQMMRVPAPPVGGGVLLRDEFDGAAGTSIYSHTPDEVAIPGAAWGDFYGENNDDFQLDGTGNLEIHGPNTSTFGWVGITVPAVSRRCVLEVVGKSNYYNLAAVMVRDIYAIGYNNRYLHHFTFNGSVWQSSSTVDATNFQYKTPFTIETIDTGTNIQTTFTDINGVFYVDNWAIPDPTIDECVGIYTRTTDGNLGFPFSRFQVDAI